MVGLSPCLPTLRESTYFERHVGQPTNRKQLHVQFLERRATILN
jgi:hypothetical protein